MRCLFSLFYVTLIMLAVSLTGYTQELPFYHYANTMPASGEVLAFQQNSNKEILIVTSEGVEAFDGKKTRRLYSFSQNKLFKIKQAIVTADHSLSLLTEQGLFAIDLRTAEKKKLQADAIDKIFYRPQQEQLYATINGSLYLLEKNGVAGRVLENAKDTQTIIFGETEIIMVGHQRLNFYSTSWAFKESIQLAEPVLDTYYNKGKLLVLTRQAVFSKEESAGLKRYHSLEGVNASCLLEDQAGRIWIGTENAGVLLIAGNQRKSLGGNNNFPLTGIKGIYEGPDFALWFYGKEGIAFKSLSSPFQKYKLGLHLAGDVIQDVHQLDTGKVAILTRDNHYHITEGEGIASSAKVMLPFVPAFARIINADQSIYVSKQGALQFFFKDSKFSQTLNNEVSQVFSFENETLLLDREGNLFGFNHQAHTLNSKNWRVAAGKLLFQSGSFLVYTHPSGELKKWSSIDNTHTGVGNDPEGILLGALFQNESLLYLSKKHELKHASEKGIRPLNFKLPENETVTGLSISGTSLWISTPEKLYQIGLSQEENQLLLAEVKIFKAGEYPIELPLLESCEYADGRFLLASASSFLLYDPLAMVPDVSPPGLQLDKLSIKNKDDISYVTLDSRDSVNVAMTGTEQLMIKAFAVQYGHQNKAVLKYRFLSQGDQWKQAIENELIILSELEAGNHVVELATENEQGVKSNTRKFLLLSVSQPAAYSWWSVLGVSLSLMVFGYFAYGGIKSAKEGKAREAKEKWEKELLKLQRKSHEQMMKAEGLKQVNELISAQKAELEDKNKQIVAQKYELSLTNNQIKQQKDLIQKTSESLQSSINYAMRIQSALMGDEVKIKDDLAESFVFFKPRDQVSGDFFWFQKARNEQGEEVLAIAAVDCTGHGVPGAIVSVVGIQLLNAIVSAKGITDPGKILSELNADLLKSLNYEQTKINDGMDMCLCTVNLKSRKLYYAGAKNPLYMVENGELEIIKGDKQPIGGQKLKEEKEYTTHEVLLKGEGRQMFYLCSDGYQDQFGGPDQSKFMAKHFKNLLIEISDKPVMEQKYILAKTIADWQGEQEQTDDMLVLGFRL